MHLSRYAMDIEIDYVITVSSEAENAPATNLIYPDKRRSWLTQAKGISEATVDLKLKKSEKISSITIGNHECSMIMIEVGSR